MQALIEHLQSFIPLDVIELNMILSKATKKTVKRKQMLVQEGFVCKYYTFVLKGCFRMYALDERGNEHNLQFAAENDWISDLDSFYSGKPSKLFIEAIESGVIIQIEQQDLYSLFTHIPKLNRIFKVIVEHKFIEFQNRVLQNISSTAEQRYLNFLEQYPPIVQRIPNTQIASYLGITPEFLSKIRKDLSKKQNS